jgi:hypothetical protein
MRYPFALLDPAIDQRAIFPRRSPALAAFAAKVAPEEGNKAA